MAEIPALQGPMTGPISWQDVMSLLYAILGGGEGFVTRLKEFDRRWQQADSRETQLIERERAVTVRESAVGERETALAAHEQRLRAILGIEASDAVG